MKKVQEKKLDVAEMTMSRLMCRVTKMDRMRNWRTTKVRDISKKVQERKLKWDGHVMRRDEEYVGKRLMRMDVERKRRSGRPKRRRMDSVKCGLGT